MSKVSYSILGQRKKIEKEKMKKQTQIIVILGVCLFGLGFLIKEIISLNEIEKKDAIIKDLKEKLHIEIGNKTFDGLYFEANYNWSEAIKYSYDVDNYGKWVCVNVAGLNYERIFDVCVHECGHSAYSEIFAENCEKNFTKCGDFLNNK
jgi:hypothetical protein